MSGFAGPGRSAVSLIEADIAGAGDTRYLRKPRALAAGQDFNTVTSSGSYYTVDATSPNAPTTGFFWYLEVREYSDPANYLLQTATVLNGTAPTTYIRCKVGSWLAWMKIAPIDSPAFTGTPTAPTPATADNSTKLATTAWVNNAFGALTLIHPTPTPSSSGAYTSTSTNIYWGKVGKWIFCHGYISVANIGTGAGALTLQLPFTLNDRVTFAGKECAINGIMFSADVLANGLLTLLKYDNTWSGYIVNGAVFQFSFVGEAP